MPSARRDPMPSIMTPSAADGRMLHMPLSLLHLAAISDDAALARSALRSGVGVDAVTSGGRTPLWLASAHGSTEVADVLTSAGAGVESMDDAGHGPLWAAASHGHARLVDQLMRAGASPHALDERGRGALWAAAEGGHQGVVTALAAEGADVNDGAPLGRASGVENADMVQLLLALGADGAELSGGALQSLSPRAGHGSIAEPLQKATAGASHIGAGAPALSDGAEDVLPHSHTHSSRHCTTPSAAASTGGRTDCSASHSTPRTGTSTASTLPVLEAQVAKLRGAAMGDSASAAAVAGSSGSSDEQATALWRVSRTSDAGGTCLPVLAAEAPRLHGCSTTGSVGSASTTTHRTPMVTVVPRGTLHRHASSAGKTGHGDSGRHAMPAPAVSTAVQVPDLEEIMFMASIKDNSLLMFVDGSGTASPSPYGAGSTPAHGLDAVPRHHAAGGVGGGPVPESIVRLRGGAGTASPSASSPRRSASERAPLDWPVVPHAQPPPFASLSASTPSAGATSLTDSEPAPGSPSGERRAGGAPAAGTGAGSSRKPADRPVHSFGHRGEGTTLGAAPVGGRHTHGGKAVVHNSSADAVGECEHTGDSSGSDSYAAESAGGVASDESHTSF